MDETEAVEVITPLYERLVRATTLTVAVVGLLVLLHDLASPLLLDAPGSPRLRIASAVIVVAALVAREVDVEEALGTGRQLWVLHFFPLLVAVALASLTPEFGQAAFVTLGLVLALNVAGFISNGPIAGSTLAVLFTSEISGLMIAPEPDPRWTVSALVVGIAVLWTSRAVVAAAATALALQHEATEEVARVSAAREDFIATVSHELRTPIHVTTGFAETLDARWELLGPDDRRALVERLHGSSANLRALVDGLLDFSRIRADSFELRAGVFDLTCVADKVVTAASSAHPDHVIRLDAADGVVALGDPLLVERVVDNLVQNACNHTPSGTTVTVVASVGDLEVALRVEDDGPGIAAADLPRLAERFFRGGDHLQRDTGGVGLGLALCDEVLRLHGRSLIVTSEPGRGASFGFTLPSATAPPRRRQEPVRPLPTGEPVWRRIAGVGQ